MLSLWVTSIHTVFTPHAREAVRYSSVQFPQEPVISVVYIEKASSLKLLFSVVSSPSTEPQKELTCKYYLKFHCPLTIVLGPLD